MKELKIEKLSDLGVGIAYDGMDEIYIKNALPGEVVLTKIKDYFAKGSKRREGEVVKTIIASPYRREPLCRHFYDCGGCHVQHLQTQAQYDLKLSLIKDAVAHMKLSDKVSDNLISNVESNNNIESYRNKSIRKFALSSGQIICGFYEPYSHKVIHIENCCVEPAWFSKVCHDLCAAFSEHNIDIYDEKRQNGIVREILLREASGQRLVMLYVARSACSKLNDILMRIKDKYAIDVLAIALREDNSNSLNKVSISYLSAVRHIKATILDFNYKIGVNTFMQVNEQAMAKMYKEVIDFICTSPQKLKALDLCCGVGTMTLPLTLHFKEVTGVEIVAGSIEAAKDNAGLNHIENVNFVCADIADYLKNTDLHEVSAIIADPSRVGLGEQNVKAICALQQPLHLALIFCSLKACSRDLTHFVQAGFKVHRIIGVDMFEHSMHVETVCLLSRD